MVLESPYSAAMPSHFSMVRKCCCGGGWGIRLHCNRNLQGIFTNLSAEAASAVRLVRPRPDHILAGRLSRPQTAETV